MLERIKDIDELVVDKITVLHTPHTIKIMRFFTYLGNQGKIWFALCIPMLLVSSWRMLGCNILASLAITCLAGEGIIKHLVCRIRPCHMISDSKLVVKKRPSQDSFPSGHSASSFSVFTVMAFWCWQLSIPILIVALLIAFSRIFLQVHYLTDVIVGILLGVLCGVLSVQIFERIIL